MEILEAFRHYLFTNKKHPSKVTIKNYVADVRKFITWYEGYYQKNFFPSDVTQLVIDAYKKELMSAIAGAGETTSSFKSYKRYMASLKCFSGFLQSQGIITNDPFPIERKPEAPADPWMLRGFKNSLSNANLSRHSIKNYLNDIHQFVEWYKTVRGIGENKAENSIFSGINNGILEEYKQRLSLDANYSPVTINRKLSSLRKYLNWLNENKIITSSFKFENLTHVREPILAEELEEMPEIEQLKQFAAYNHEDKTPRPKPHPRFGPVKLTLGMLTLCNNIFDYLIISPIVNVSSFLQYTLWKKQGKIVFQPVKQIFHTKKVDENITRSVYSNQSGSISKDAAISAKLLNRWEAFVLNRKPPGIKAPGNITKSFYAPLDISLTNLPWYKKFWFIIRHYRPDWYKKYHSYPIVHYIHFAIVLVCVVVVGINIYSILFTNSLNRNPVLAETAVAPPRTLAFQGRLTNSLNNPITAETPLRFGIYNDATATGSALVWQEVQDVTPDQNGFFSVTLGRNHPINQNIFTDNPNLYIGITIGSNPELEPRQQLATTNYAANAATLQGLKPITETNAGTNNVLLALDSTGNLTIGGSANPTFETSGGEFTLSGQTLTLTTDADSNTNIQISPDGTGIIDLQKPLQNTTNYSNIPGVQGAVEVDDSLAVLATTSAQPAFIINQNGSGELISASTSGLAKFTVDNVGSGMFAGNLAINGNNLTSTATSFNLLNTNTISLSIGGNASALSLGSPNGTTTINNSLVVSKLATFAGGLLIPAGQTLSFNGSVSSNLIPSGDDLYNLGSSTNRWQNAYLTNLTIGGSATLSATPVATFSANTTDTAVTINNNGSGNLLSVAANNVNKFVITQNGSIGIGNPLPAFKLDLQDDQAATAAAQIYNTDTGNDADGLIVKLGNSSNTTVPTTNHFINFETAGIGIVGSIQGNGSKGITFVQNGVADFAEYFKKDARQTIAYGSLVCVDQDGKVVPCDSANTNIVGVTSAHPAFLGGENLGDGSVAVGLTGLVMTNVATLHGSIKPGDLIAASAIPGVGVKATEPGMIVGRALEGYTSDDPNAVGSILVSVHISWFAPQNQLTADGTIQESPSTNPGAIANAPLALDSEKTIIDGTPLKDFIANSIVETINNQQTLSINILKTNQIQAAINNPTISLAFSSDKISILNSQLSTPSPVAEFDNNGNARFSGELTAADLRATDATISGTLHVKDLSADAIEGLDQKLATLAASITNAKNSNLSTNQSKDNKNAIAKASTGVSNSATPGATSDNELQATSPADIAPLANQDTAKTAPALYASSNPFNLNSSLINNFADIASISGQLATVGNLKTDVAMVNQNLMVFGTSSLSDVAVNGQLAIGGSFILTQNSMNTIGGDLQLQSLRQGDLSIMAGLVKIDTDGNLSVSGNATFAKNVTVKGTLATNTIIPNQDSDLSIQLGKNNGVPTNPSESPDSRFVIRNASGSGVLAINQLGNLISSGTGAFSQLAAQGLHIIRGAQADTSLTDTTASGSAGKAVISAYQTHRTIFTPYVTANSLIYITPTSDTKGVTPYISRQTPEDKTSNSRGSFTIEIPTAINKDISLNWWIVN